MTTYRFIAETILHLNNNVFSKNYTNDNIDYSIKLLFNIFLKDEVTVKKKFIFFEETLKHFLIVNIKNEFIYYFFKIQKTYNVLNKFVYNYKYKKARLVVNTDIGLNELNTNDKNVICLFHNNSKYLFLITDLIKIINSSLTNSYMFFSQPKSIKNPYDNIPFNKSNLYNIYFFITHKTNYHNDLFFYFFNTNFNLNVFRIKHEILLRQYIIENFVKKSSADVLLLEIRRMIKFFNKNCKPENMIYIDKDFPSHKLIKIMKPYLYYYCISQYGHSQHIQRVSIFVLKKKLLEFNKFNPQFGRKRYKIITKTTNNFKKKICGKVVEFDDFHIKFLESNNSDFFSDHLTYKESFITDNTFFFVDEDQDLIDDIDDNDNDDNDNDNDDNDNDSDENLTVRLEEVEENNDYEEVEENNDYEEIDSVS